MQQHITTPAHYYGIGCKATFQDLIPANDLAAFAVEVFLNTLNEITL